MESLTYYQTLTKKELKYRLKLADGKLQDVKYKGYLHGTICANEYVYQEDVDNIQAALSMPRRKVSAKKAKPLDNDGVVYEEVVYELHALDGSFVNAYSTKSGALAAKSEFDANGVAVEYQVGMTW